MYGISKPGRPNSFSSINGIATRTTLARGTSGSTRHGRKTSGNEQDDDCKILSAFLKKPLMRNEPEDVEPDLDVLPFSFTQRKDQNPDVGVIDLTTD